MDFLLGTPRSAADIKELRGAGIDYDGFFEFFADDANSDEARTARHALLDHRAELVAAAHRRGVTPAWMAGDQ